MKIIVTGARGMLGREVYTAAVNASAQTLGLDHADLDITERRAVRAVLEDHRPDVVINCAGLTKHRTPEPTRDEYMVVNCWGPQMLREECDAIGARLIHVSTDCVFSGNRPIDDGPYTEDDTPDATDGYGASKFYGEVTRAPHLTVRCSFVGMGDRGLIAWLRGKPDFVMGWAGALWSGSTASAISRALVELAQRPETTGLMHLTGGKHSKAELIEGLMEAKIVPWPGQYATSIVPEINRELASNRSDVPALPPLHEALRELAGSC